jgi:hypothetical protein
MWIVGTLAIAGLIVTMHGIANGAETRWLVRDGRPVLYTVLGSIVGSYLLRDRENWQWGLRATTILLATLAFLLVANQLTSQPIIGSDTAANTLYYGDTAIDLTSRRSRIEAGALSTFIVAGLFAVFCSGLRFKSLVGSRTVLVLAASTVTILFLSYSRNTVLALAAAGLIGATIRTSEPWLNHVLRTATVALLLGAIAVPLIFVAAQVKPVGDALQAFDQRVIGGLSSKNRAADSSTQWRSTEGRLALDAIARAPLAGTGIGVFYRPSVQGEPFTDDGGKLYSHNYYYWLLIKGGVAYLSIIAGLTLMAIGRLLAAARPSDVAQPLYVFAAAGLTGIAATSWVAPFAAQTDFSALLGAIVAASIAIREARTSPAGEAAQHQQSPTSVGRPPSQSRTMRAMPADSTAHIRSPK